MPGIFYDPNLFAYGDAVGAGLNAYGSAQDAQLKKIQRDKLYADLAQQAALKQGLAGIAQKDATGFYSPTTTQGPIPASALPGEDLMPPAPVTAPAQGNRTQDMRKLYEGMGDFGTSNQILQMSEIERKAKEAQTDAPGDALDKAVKRWKNIAEIDKTLHKTDGALTSTFIQKDIEANPQLKEAFGGMDFSKVKVAYVDESTMVLNNLKRIYPGKTAEDFEITVKTDKDGNLTYSGKPKKEPAEKTVPLKNEQYYTDSGVPVLINRNDPIDQARVTNEGLMNQTQYTNMTKDTKEPDSVISIAKGALREKLGRDPTRSELDDELKAREVVKNKSRLEVSVAGAEARGKSYGDIRQTTVLDTKNNNEMSTMTANDFHDANKEEPGRFLDSAKAQKALNSTALLQDIRGAITNSRKSTANLKTDFSETDRLLLYKAVSGSNPSGSISNFVNGQFGKALSIDQIDYLTDLNQLVENAMAMRAVLGAGQGSDQLRDAIKATIPNKGTFSKVYAQSQLDKFEQQVNRLARGVPTVKLANPQGIIESGGNIPAPMAQPGVGRIKVDPSKVTFK
jgi:hypothetical protein